MIRDQRTIEPRLTRSCWVVVEKELDLWACLWIQVIQERFQNLRCPGPDIESHPQNGKLRGTITTVQVVQALKDPLRPCYDRLRCVVDVRGSVWLRERLRHGGPIPSDCLGNGVGRPRRPTRCSRQLYGLRNGVVHSLRHDRAFHAAIPRFRKDCLGAHIATCFM
jgi:hypothetical protein